MIHRPDRGRTQFLLPTPAGALRAVSAEQCPEREMLRALLRADVTIELSEPELRRSIPEITSYRAVELVTELRRLQLIEMHPQPYQLGDMKLELVLPELLDRLSGGGRGLLADNEGFLVGAAGFEEGAAARLAAMASDLVDFDRQWRGLLDDPPTGDPPVWWAGGPDGSVRYGLLMLTIGRNPFVLVVEGHLNLVDPALVWLVWALVHRYDNGPLGLSGR